MYERFVVPELVNLLSLKKVSAFALASDIKYLVVCNQLQCWGNSETRQIKFNSDLVEGLFLIGVYGIFVINLFYV